jgi:tetratricopeptide (TPR) repeat protein
MGGSVIRDVDPAALVLIFLIVVIVAGTIGTIVYRNRRKFPRWLRSSLKRRLDVVVRDLDRMADYVDNLAEGEPQAWQPFDEGLTAMAAYRWDKALAHFETAQAAAGGRRLVPVLNQLGICRYFQGRLPEALREFTEAARLAEAGGDTAGRVLVLNNIGIIRHETGELGLALRVLNQARTLARESSNPAAEVFCLLSLGNTLRDRGDLPAAQKSLEEALALARRLGDEHCAAGALAGLGSILRDRGESDKALDRYAEAVELTRKLDYKMGTAIILGNIGSLYRVRRDFDRALDSHKSALALTHEIGYRLGTATALTNIGLILVSRRMHDRAVPYLAEVLTAFLDAGAANGPRQALYGLSKCDDVLGREQMQAQLLRAGLPAEAADDLLARVDQIRSRRPWLPGRQRNPFAPVVRAKTPEPDQTGQDEPTNSPQ